MNAIAVVDRNWGIGQKGKLLLHLPGDLKYFKEKTIGKTIIIGRETFVGMGGKLLPDRETIILSQSEGLRPDCSVIRSVEDVLAYIRDKCSEEIFVAGGESIYRLFLQYCDKVFITKVHAKFEADRHFPNLDKKGSGFEIVETGDIIEENGVKYQFLEYQRIKNLETK